MTAAPPERFVETPAASVAIQARVEGGERPVLLAIRGAWAPRSYLVELFDLLPDVDIVLGHLPGMISSAPPRADMATFCAAYDGVVAELLGGRRVVAFGASTGALVALGMRAPEVRSRVLMEPFFSSTGLWPLIPVMQRRIAEGNALTARYIFELFGITAQGCENRDYSRFLDAVETPVHVLAGAVPLDPPRQLANWPSFTDEAARRRLAAHPRTTLHEGPPGSGHHLTGTPEGARLLVEVLRQALAEA